jgi:hypothetical protein
MSYVTRDEIQTTQSERCFGRNIKPSINRRFLIQSRQWQYYWKLRTLGNDNIFDIRCLIGVFAFNLSHYEQALSA